MNAIQLLKRARQRINKGHCKGHYAVDEMGAPCPAEGDRAVAWCMLGALGLRDPDIAPDTYLIARNCVARLLSSEGSVISILDFNDDAKRTKEQVLEVLDSAIKRLGKAVG